MMITFQDFGRSVILDSRTSFETDEFRQFRPNRLPHQIHQKTLQFHDFSRSAKVSQSLQPCNLFPHYHQQTATAPDHNTKSPVVQSSFPQRYSATTKLPNAATWVAVVSNGNMWSLQSQPQMRFLPPEHISIISIISIISNNHKSNSKSRVFHMVLPPWFFHLPPFPTWKSRGPCSPCPRGQGKVPGNSHRSPPPSRSRSHRPAASGSQSPCLKFNSKGRLGRLGF